MPAVGPIRIGIETERTGVIARPVSKALLSVDQWDLMLVVGLVSLVIGVGWQWGLAVALIVGGVLLAIGGLYGARSEAAGADSEQ